MANKNSAQTETIPEVTATPEEVQAPPTIPYASVYSIAELAGAARTQFGVPPEVVTVALKTAGKTSAALEEAKLIVAAFLEREVK
jgi:hypothetical protein